MACKNCKSKKKNEKKSELLYIMNPRCGWCKKADSVVEELRKDGYNITTVDATQPEGQSRTEEMHQKHGAKCGTPMFIDAKSGNMVCGFREKDVLEKWAKGEEVPAPPARDFRKVDPNNPAQKPEPPKFQMVKLEYIWVDGASPANLRSKVRFETIETSTIENQGEFLKNLPEWSFDGSSTGQAEVDNSDLVLKPVKLLPNTPERTRTPSFVVLCEVYDTEGYPHKSNKRASLRESLKDGKMRDMAFGIEQEYVITNPIDEHPFGWDQYENNTPNTQGDYYCGVGADVTAVRDLSETHSMICNSAGIRIAGTNAEVMLSQWEYQLKETNALDACDNLWISRFFLQRIAERMKMSISYSPKLIEEDDWNGSGAHINFSTKKTREDTDMSYILFLCSFLGESHKEAISHYGIGNDKRLTGKNETSSYEEFSWGEMDRSASIRIPHSTVTNGKGYLEDRRPAANVDPYEAIGYLSTTLLKINEEMLIAT
tara:strand:+ start:194 stop:1651 length:1458 start_codon:yes stop_codon:yes gene_type:complete